MSGNLELGLKLAIAAIAILIAIRSPFHAFCVFLVSLPFEDALAIRGPLTIAPSYLALLALLLVCVVHPGRSRITGSMSSQLNPYVLAYVGVAVFSLMVTIVSPPPQIDARSQLLRWRASAYRGVLQSGFLLFSVTAYFLTLFFCSTARRLRFAVSVFLVMSATVALYGIYQVVGVRFRMPLVGLYAAGLYEQPASLRPNATFQEPMIFGHFLLAGMPLLASLLLSRPMLDGSDRRTYGAAAAIMLLVMVAALVLTIGRAAWLGALVAAVTIVMASGRNARIRTLIVFSVAVVVGIGVFVIAMGSPAVAWTTVANRFVVNTASVESEQRLWYRSLLVQLIRQHPILGVGYGNYPLYQLSRYGLSSIAGAFGVFWQSLVETGALGFCALVLMFAKAERLLLVTAWRDRNGAWRPYLIGWMASLSGLLVCYLFMSDRLNLYVWATLGLAMACVKRAALEAARTENG